MCARVRLTAIALLALAAPPAGAKPPAGTHYALLVGVDRYETLTPLSYAVADVTGLAAALTGSAGYRAADVVLMTQARAAEELRYAPQARKVRKELKLLRELCQPGDTLLVALAGHGVQLKDDPEHYFCPADADLEDKATLVGLGEVYRELEGCKASVKLLLVDACRNDPRRREARALEAVRLESVTRPEVAAPPGGTAAFFSCSAGQRAYEHPKLAHGVFFHFVIEGLRGKAADAGGLVTVPDLEKYLKREVKAFVARELGEVQLPEVRNSTRDLVPINGVGGLVRKGEELLRRNDFAGALAVYDAAVEATPGAADAHAGRAYALGSCERMADAEAALAQAVRLDAQSSRTRWAASRLATLRSDHGLALREADAAVELDPVFPNALTRRGTAHLMKRDWDHSLADAAEAIRLAPDCVGAYEVRCQVHLMKGDLDRSLADATELIRLAPGSGLGHVIRARVFFRRGDFDRAIEAATEGIRATPRLAGAYTVRADAYRMKADYPRAAGEAAEAIRIDPNNALAYAVSAECRRMLNQYDRAVAEATDAIRLDPDNAFAYRVRAESHRLMKQYDRAVEDATEAIRLSPAFGKAYLTRSEAWRMKGDYDRAVEDATEAIRHNPDETSAYYNRADARRMKGDYAGAVADATEAIKLDPKSVLAYSTRAEAWRQKGDAGRAVADATEAIRLDPKHAFAYRTRAEAGFLESGDHSRALADAVEAYRLAPTDLHLETRAEAYRVCEKFDEAVADATELIRKGSRPARAYSTRADALRMKSEYDRAIADATESLRLRPNSAFTYRTRAEAHRRTGNPDRAIADATEALRLEPGSAFALRTRAAAYRMKGEEALADADAAAADRTGSKTPAPGGKVSRGLFDALATGRPVERSPAAGAVAGPEDEVLWEVLGVRVTTAAVDAVRAANPELKGGLRVTGVRPNGPAAAAGFQAGDILVGLHTWETVTTANVIFVLDHNDLKSFLPLKFFLVRGGQVRRGFLPLQLSDGSAE